MDFPLRTRHIQRLERIASVRIVQQAHRKFLRHPGSLIIALNARPLLAKAN